VNIRAITNVLRGGHTLTRDTAMVCASANLTLPGLGSLAAGSKFVGVVQLFISFLALVLTLVCGTTFLQWSFQNWTRIHQPQDDFGFALIGEMWAHARWALLGIFLFAFVWLWGCLSSYLIMRRFPKQPRTPPRIQP
jgi:hypothetical protein